MTILKLRRKDKFDNLMLTKLLKRKFELLSSIQTFKERTSTQEHLDLKPNELEIVSILYIFHMCK